MKCSSCGFESSPGMKFCGGCGAELGGACSSCGRDNPPGFRFCGHCGAAIDPNGAAPGPARGGQPGSPTAIPAERRQLTVMFCDLVDSTPLAEQLDPEDLRELVLRYQETVARCAERYSGHIAQYLGDGLLIYFGFPRAHEDDATRAVVSGLAVLSAMENLNKELAESHGIKLRVRLGVHTGDVVTGGVGAGESEDQLAIGTTPNIAARVQAMAQAGQVLLTTSTLALTGSAFEVEDLGEQEIRGITKPMAVYRALGARDADSFRDLQESPFIGRRRELQQLLRLFDQVCAGQGQTVLLTGEPGHGKTRLQWELRRQTTETAHAWLICRCSSYHENTALHPFVELIQRIVGITPTQSLDEQNRAFEAWLKDQSPAVRQLSNYLGHLLRLLPQGALEDGAPERIRRGTEDAILTLLYELAEQGPLVLMVEDLHWADNTTLELLDELIRSLGKRSVLLICSARPSFTPSWTPTDRQTFISLLRFGDEEAREFIRDYGPERLTPMVVAEIIRRSDGVPLYLEELTQTLRDNVKLVQDAQELSNRIPSSLRDSLASRLDALGPAKEVVQLGALLGRHFTGEMLAAVSTLPADTLDDLMQRIVDSGLLRRTGSGSDANYAFKHALVQDAAYETLLKSRRRRLHELVVNALKTQFPDMLQAQPELAARHMEGAELHAEATEHYRRAGASGAARWSLAEALRNYRSALRCLARLPQDAERDRMELGILEEMSEPTIAYSGHGSDEQAELQRRVVEVKDAQRPNSFNNAVNLWGVEATRGNREKAVELSEQLAVLAEGIDQQLVKVHAAFATGCTAFYDGRLERAINDLDRAVALADHGQAYGSMQTDFQGFVLMSRLIRTWANAIAGRLEASLDELDLISSACRAARQPFALAQSLCHTCVVLEDVNEDPEKVLGLADEVMRIAEDHDMGIWKQYAHMARGWSRAKMGEVAGLEELQRALDLYTFDEVTKGHSLVMLADARWSMGQAEPALETLDQSLAFFETNLAQFYEPEALRLKAEILHGLSRHDEALELLGAGAQIAAAQGAGLLSARIATTRMELAPSAEAFEELRGIMAQLPDPAGIPCLSAGLAFLES